MIITGLGMHCVLIEQIPLAALVEESEISMRSYVRWRIYHIAC